MEAGGRVRHAWGGGGVSLNLPPSYTTIDRCLALIPDDWDWCLTKHEDTGGMYLCRIFNPEFSRVLRAHAVPGGFMFKADDQPDLKFEGWGTSPLEAVVAAIREMEAA